MTEGLLRVRAGEGQAGGAGGRRWRGEGSAWVGYAGQGRFSAQGKYGHTGKGSGLNST